MAYKVEIIADECISCGVCEATCPEVYKLGDDGKSIVLQAVLEDLGCAEEGADNCPTQCIEIKEA